VRRNAGQRVLSGKEPQGPLAVAQPPSKATRDTGFLIFRQSVFQARVTPPAHPKLVFGFN